MYVCICNAVTEREVNEAIEDGARTLQDLRDQAGVARCCGKCASYAVQLLEESTTPRLELVRLKAA